MTEYILHASVPNPKPKDTMFVSLPPIKIDNTRFYGWKMVHVKKVSFKDKKNKDREKIVADESKPVSYDSKTQQLMNDKQTPIILSQLLLNNNNVKINHQNQLKLNAQLLLQINQLKQKGVVHHE